jgi:hypothetical protein
VFGVDPEKEIYVLALGVWNKLLIWIWLCIYKYLDKYACRFTKWTQTYFYEWTRWIFL